MKQYRSILILLIFIISFNNIHSQCANSVNIYSFVYNGHSYEVVKENKSWIDASSCAVIRNGYLVEINDAAEQNAIFQELTNNAGIVISNTQNEFGTAAVWIGGNDAGTEGKWIWDGDNNGTGTQFWSGGPTGSSVGGSYTKWGINPAEPDNSGGQDHLAITIKPTAVNFGLWNDLNSATNTIYYLIERNSSLSLQDIGLKNNLSIYPSPFKNVINIHNNNSIAIKKIEIFNNMGQKINTFNPQEIINNKIIVEELTNGIYILNVHFENGILISQKIIK